MSPNELTALRERLALSQAALADALGVDVGTVSRWERGVQRISKMADLAVKTLRPKR